MQRILVVDDTKNIRLLLCKYLEMGGYSVDAANDGKVALELFEKNKYDLAFLDIKLPEVRGTEVLRRIREKGITTPVVIITAYATVKNAVDCTKLGAVAYLQKPFTGEKIMSLMKDIFNENYEVSKTIKIIEESENAKEYMMSRVNNSYDIAQSCQKAIPNMLLKEASEYIALGDGIKSIDILKKVLSLDIENPIVYKLLSQSYELIGNIEMGCKFNSIYNILKNK